MNDVVPVALSVSVALCTYNGERYVADQLRSIFEQTVLPDELVISDDGSTDATNERVSDALLSLSQQISPRKITVIRLSNSGEKGVSRNFEAAVRATRCELIFLSDQDDVWHPDRVRRAVEEFARRPELTLLFADADLVDADGKPLRRTLFGTLGISARQIRRLHRGDGYRELLKRNLVTGATTAFRRELRDLAVPFPDSWVHDEWLAIVAAAAGRIDVLASSLIDYRQHENNVIGVASLSASGAVGKLLEHRGDRISRQVQRSAVLLNRLGTIRPPVDASVVALAGEKHDHECTREALPRMRIARIVGILREAAKGRYGAYGRGLVDVVRDLVQLP